ncbi:Predicted N-acetyltransferase YhbS [Paenibacillus catalpae]|uniref:Predicted N-acetyltransferase YhbS n=1 Tax=Paenibacillus catalpae TaxID=1045775 RepID=A0A1I2D902_9BACL|nr:GNAT family N-acetyltransferase [Paenibacillus catalpae]SFE76959.1 Predicted N-acetyltransferase YhbS [Paenibacillus catalpae]
MSVEYRIEAPVTAVQVAEVFRSSGIKRPVDNLARIQKMIDNADLTVTAWDGDELVGVARAVTDFSYCCYLSDLAVSKTHQRLGIGTELVSRLREHLGEEVSLLLLSAPSAMDYYPQIGFNKADNAFLIKRVR